MELKKIVVAGVGQGIVGVGGGEGRDGLGWSGGEGKRVERRGSKFRVVASPADRMKRSPRRLACVGVLSSSRKIVATRMATGLGSDRKISAVCVKPPTIVRPLRAGQ